MQHNGNSDHLAEYWAEVEETLDRINQGLRALEKNNTSSELIDTLYREFHTLKGTAQLFSMSSLGQVAHTLEASLDLLRKDPTRISSGYIELLYRGTDVLEQLVVDLKEAGGVDTMGPAIQIHLAQLVDLSLENVGGTLTPMRSSAPHSDQADLNLKVNSTQRIEKPASEPIKEVSVVKTSGSAPQENSPSSAQEQERPSSGVASAPRAKAAGPSADEASAAATEASTIRVPVGLLDRLMTLMGEMVLVRNQVLQYSSKSDDLGFLNLSQRLDVVTSEIQSEMMKTRMQPMGNILNKFQRLVRDLSKELGKKIELELSGTETELDKSLLEAVKDPLTHIIRNSCDHGMEMPADRLRAGKPEQGTVKVKSYHEGGQVIIEVSDDGRGLNREVIVRKAIEKGLITKERAETMSDREAQAIIFMPGFSTAAQVTNISGRGVGMDVVRQNIERIGGVVDLQSKQGEGTTIRLKIPLTLAIVPAMIVRCEEDQYAIPQVKLVELLRIEQGSSENKIEMLQGRQVLRLRGNLLPLMNLKEFLGFHSADKMMVIEPGKSMDVVNIVILRAESQMFGLIVDEILDTADIVVKPLSRFLKSLNIYSGATVLGDGSVALILDVMGISQRMHLEIADSSEAQEDATKQKGYRSDQQEFLLFRLNVEAKHAIPLDLVHRLEEFKVSELEYSGRIPVMRYRGSILPILSLNKHLEYEAPAHAPTQETIPVIVTQRSGRPFGIQVNEILDVLSTESNIDLGLSDRPGLLGSMISGREVVNVVDVLGILEKFMKTEETAAGMPPKDGPRKATSKIRVLYAEDNAFFRKHVTGLLEREGFTVRIATNGLEALEILNQDGAESFDIILSDIEMPVMNGTEFVRNARQKEEFKKLPFIALSTRGSNADIEAGLSAGFNFYLEKLNTVELIDTVKKMKERKAS